MFYTKFKKEDPFAGKIKTYNDYPAVSPITRKAKSLAQSVSFFAKPKTYSELFIVPHTTSYTIIPTYKPTEVLVKLVEDIITYNFLTTVVVVNDCSPVEYDETFERIRAISPKRVVVLRTDKNRLKAGAINLALHYIKDSNVKADLIYTLDDDIKIDAYTLGNMASELLRDDRLGAVCSQARVLNKNKNLLTRLQGLEYHGYNVVRTAEAGFFQGPLVMHGMLTAFRFNALMSVGDFATGHLIEDYEITTRLKKHGYDVKFARYAKAWTEVPENFNALWKQRIRWSLGGVLLLSKERYIPAVLQDVIGHIFYITTLICIALFLFVPSQETNTSVIFGIASIAIANSVISYIFTIAVMKSYEEADFLDYVMRFAIIPEFIYSNILTLVLIGTYLYFAYIKLVQKVLRYFKHTQAADELIHNVFLAIGFSKNWGTK